MFRYREVSIGQGCTEGIYFTDINKNRRYDAGEMVAASFNYTLDSRGNRTQSVDTVDGQTYTYTWQYDGLNRLVSEQLDASDNTLDYTDTFTFDRVGNRMTQTRDAGSDGSVEETTSYTYDGGSGGTPVVKSVLRQLDRYPVCWHTCCGLDSFCGSANHEEF